jgi:hypothetical protein
MARDHKAVYQARNESARARGFSSYNQERAYRAEHKEAIQSLRENTDFFTKVGKGGEGGYLDSRHAVMYYQGEGRFLAGDADIDSLDDVERRYAMHDYIAYLLEFTDVNEAEALAMARELFGES